MARKHVSLRISEKSDEEIRALSEEYGVPYAVVLRVTIATGFQNFTEIRRNLETIRKAN